MASAVANVAVIAGPLSSTSPPKQAWAAAKSSRLMGTGLRTTAASQAQLRSRSSLQIVAAVTPEKEAELSRKLQELIQEAKDLCASGSTGECAAMWDNIEEISAEQAHMKIREKENSDPLEKFCNDNPETDECRTYED